MWTRVALQHSTPLGAHKVGPEKAARNAQQRSPRDHEDPERSRGEVRSRCWQRQHELPSESVIKQTGRTQVSLRSPRAAFFHHTFKREIIPLQTLAERRPSDLIGGVHRKCDRSRPGYCAISTAALSLEIPNRRTMLSEP